MKTTETVWPNAVRKQGASRLIASAGALSITVVLTNSSQPGMEHAVTVNNCALRQDFGGSELRASVAVTTSTGEIADSVFVRVSFNGRIGQYVAALDCPLDFVTAIDDNQLARRLLKSNDGFRKAVEQSLELLVVEQVSATLVALRATP